MCARVILIIISEWLAWWMNMPARHHSRERKQESKYNTLPSETKKYSLKKKNVLSHCCLISFQRDLLYQSSLFLWSSLRRCPWVCRINCSSKEKSFSFRGRESPYFVGWLSPGLAVQDSVSFFQYFFPSFGLSEGSKRESAWSQIVTIKLGGGRREVGKGEKVCKLLDNSLHQCIEPLETVPRVRGDLIRLETIVICSIIIIITSAFRKDIVSIKLAPQCSASEWAAQVR